MIRAMVVGLLFSCTPLCFPVSPLAYADEVVVQQEENLPADEQPSPFPEEETPPHHQVLDVRKLFFKTLILLIGLCGLVIAGGFFLKRIAGGKLSSFTANGSIQLIERKYLSPKTSLWLVEVKNQPLVVIDSPYGVAVHSLKEMALDPTQEENAP